MILLGNLVELSFSGFGLSVWNSSSFLLDLSVGILDILLLNVFNVHSVVDISAQHTKTNEQESSSCNNDNDDSSIVGAFNDGDTTSVLILVLSDRLCVDSGFIHLHDWDVWNEGARSVSTILVLRRLCNDDGVVAGSCNNTTSNYTLSS